MGDDRLHHYQAFIAWGFTSLTVPLWILFGFFGPTGILIFSVLAQSFSAHLGGWANACLNLFVFVATFVGQWGIGIVINIWPVSLDSRYAVEGYQVAFAMMIVLQIIALLWFFVSSVHNGDLAKNSTRH